MAVDLDNVYADLVVELGRKDISLAEAGAIGVGDFVAFAKLAGEPFELFVNGHPFARTEVVVVDDRMAARITRMIGGEAAP